MKTINIISQNDNLTVQALENAERREEERKERLLRKAWQRSYGYKNIHSELTFYANEVESRERKMRELIAQGYSYRSYDYLIERAHMAKAQREVDRLEVEERILFNTFKQEYPNLPKKGGWLSKLSIFE